MILTIIWVGLIFLIVAIWIISDIFPSIDDSLTIGVIFLLSLIIAGVMGFIGICCLAEAHIGLDKTYKEWYKEYRGLEARIELWNNGAEDEMLWEDVENFNSKLENAQYWANSKWTNWYNEQECNKFEVFDIPNYERSKD